MRPQIYFREALTIMALLLLISLTGCSSAQGWASAGSGRASAAGASVSIPFGKTK